MRYAEIAESETDADSRTQRDKLASARDKVTKAAQTYQSAVKKTRIPVPRRHSANWL
jgi:hypothetical protein